VAVASAGPHASLHLAPDRQPRQHHTTQFFTGRMPFLPPNQQRQSTEGNTACTNRRVKNTHTMPPPPPIYGPSIQSIDTHAASQTCLPLHYHTVLLSHATPVVKVDRRIRWHYTTTILRLRIGARLTANFYRCTLALSAGTLMASAGTQYRLVPAHFYPCATHAVDTVGSNRPLVQALQC